MHANSECMAVQTTHATADGVIWVSGARPSDMSKNSVRHVCMALTMPVDYRKTQCEGNMT